MSAAPAPTRNGVLCGDCLAALPRLAAGRGDFALTEPLVVQVPQTPNTTN